MSRVPSSSSSEETQLEDQATTAARSQGPALACAIDAFDKRLLALLQRVNALSAENLAELLKIVFNILQDPLADSKHILEEHPQRTRLIIAAYAFFFRQSLRHDLMAPEVYQDLLTAQVQKNHAQIIAEAYKQRKPALRETFSLLSLRNSFAPLADFDWNLHLQMGGDTLAVSREPLLIVSLDVEVLPRKDHQEVVFELDRASLDNLIANLERAQMTAAQISV